MLAITSCIPIIQAIECPKQLHSSFNPAHNLFSTGLTTSKPAKQQCPTSLPSFFGVTYSAFYGSARWFMHLGEFGGEFPSAQHKRVALRTGDRR
jgi:hypothetical protein